MEILDHALVRFIERVKGVSLDEYRQELSDIADGLAWGDERAPPEDGGFLMVAWKGRLKTILPPGSRGKRDKSGDTKFATMSDPASVPRTPRPVL